MNIKYDDASLRECCASVSVERDMARRKKEDALETRESIIDAAIKVFHELGVARPSLTDIAELAGVTRGAVYGHFKNKADLVDALTARIQLPADTLCETDLRRTGPDPLGELRRRGLDLFQEGARNREWQLILDIIFHRVALVTETCDLRERVESGHAAALDRIRPLLKLAVQAEQLPADLDVKVSAAYLHGALTGILQDWLLRPGGYDLAKCGARLVDASFDVLRLSDAMRQGGRRKAKSER